MNDITTFDPDVVEAVCGHMNGDHTEDACAAAGIEPHGEASR